MPQRQLSTPIRTDAATRGAPQAIQVTDRFHVLRNVGDALETFLLHKRAHLKDAAVAAADALTPPPVAPVAVEEAYPGTHTSAAAVVAATRRGGEPAEA